MHRRQSKLTWSMVAVKKGVGNDSVNVMEDPIWCTGNREGPLTNDDESSINALRNPVKTAGNVHM